MKSAVIIGASGDIGAALIAALKNEGVYAVTAFARSFDGDGHIDLEDEASIAAAASRLCDSAPELVIVATGLLHDSNDGPEKAMHDLDPAWLARNFAVNAAGPALIAKHFLPIMPVDRIVRFAALSARVGSISDNRIGGWYGYRASKAALNMMIRTLAIEWQRKHKRSILIGLHPGTVDTKLSAPFQGNVPQGKLFDTERAALQLLDVLDELKPGDSGRIFAWDGTEIAP